MTRVPGIHSDEIFWFTEKRMSSQLVSWNALLWMIIIQVLQLSRNLITDYRYQGMGWVFSFYRIIFVGSCWGKSFQVSFKMESSCVYCVTWFRPRDTYRYFWALVNLSFGPLLLLNRHFPCQLAMLQHASPILMILTAVRWTLTASWPVTGAPQQLRLQSGFFSL